ncbi:MAG TPA: DUF6662 family protein [Candidatus Eisenbacteria bacterium]|nr:DUF6662 family protein [Candidatus Eisenbacteria bacterium]
MRIWKGVLAGVLMFGAACPAAMATTRNFTYTYEPETMPQGAFEFEEWTTLRETRSNRVGQNHYTRWDLKQEFEYGVTDNYSLSLYLNEVSEYFREPGTNAKTNDFDFDGVSFENRLMVLDPAKNAVGLTLYLEPRFGNGEIELEEKVILGQRWDRWKWAFNVSHATEWKDAEAPGEEDETEGELEFDFGATYELNQHWNLGVEFRNQNQFPEYENLERSVFYVGPVVSYRRENWWATLTFLTQCYGTNDTSPDPDGNNSLELEDHELFNVRLIIGISF